MSTNATHEAATRETTIEADPTLPTIRIVRDFDAPRDKVFRAWTDPELVVQWLGPKSTEMRIDQWNARTGGDYRYAALQDGEEVAAFYGSFHEVRPSERLVQTFTWEGIATWRQLGHHDVRGPWRRADQNDRSLCGGEPRSPGRDHGERDGGRGIRGLREA